MRIRRPWLPVVVILLGDPRAASAHGHTADAFAAYSFLRGSSLQGFHESLAVSLPRSNPADVKHVSLVGDLGIRAGSHDGNDIDQNTFLGGIRWQFARTPDDKQVWFVQGLGGAAHSHGDTVRETDFALGLNGGYEYDLRTKGWAVRGQVDYIRTGGDNFVGFSAGFVYRYKQQP